MNPSDHFPLPIPANEMPAIPLADERGPLVCATIQLYLAILEDLPPEQAQRVLGHVQICGSCKPVLHLMQQATQVFAGLPGSAPSTHVDQAIRQAIAEREHRGVAQGGENAGWAAFKEQEQIVEQPAPSRRQRSRSSWLRWRSLQGGALALAAALILALLATWHLGGWSPTTTFALPPNLSWNGYVLYHSETRIDAGGEHYQVDTYHDMSTGRMHVETIMPGSMDVIAVGDEHAMLGLDMMHHVAQWGAESWSVNDTDFDLAELRSDLKNGRAVYLDRDTFHGQPVYRIRYSDGMVLLLDIHYRPVNLLRGAKGPGTGEALYNQLEFMPSSHVASSMWVMSIPIDFHMGTLPKKP